MSCAPSSRRWASSSASSARCARRVRPSRPPCASPSLETKASISRHCAAVGRELASREHAAQSAVARAEATERDALGRHSRAAGVRREALAEAVAHGAAALSLPDGRDFIARGLSAIALLDAELAVPPGDAHAAIGAAAAPPIQGLLSGHQEPGSVAVVAPGRLACDGAQLAASGLPTPPSDLIPETNASQSKLCVHNITALSLHIELPASMLQESATEDLDGRVIIIV
jgi:hypothetical protein